MRTRKLDFVKTAVKEGYEAGGKSLSELALVYQCSVATVARCLREQGVKVKSRGRRARNGGGVKEENSGV